jgi:hypothetical protein
VKHWRILFHLAIDHALQQKLTNGSLTPTLVRERVRRLGLTEFAEITDVLRQEAYLFPPRSQAEVANELAGIYAEFVAVYLMLRRFDPARVSHFFPALRDLTAIDALVAEDVDAEAIFRSTRLPGAPEPAAVRPWITQADGLLGVPNADLGVQASRQGVPDAPLGQLGERLRNVLHLTDADVATWRSALLPLLRKSADGTWSQEARFLHDLERVCFDSEHGIHTVDVVEWVMSLGQLPIKRQLPGHQEVAIVRHLRRAADRLRLVRLADSERRDLNELLAKALEKRERLMRERFRPLIATAFDDVGLKPNNVAEEIGRAKLVEELLDRVVEFGHLNVGNLRDAISRNQMKLPDLQGPGELVLGDPLIRLNRKLAVALDGVYRRGECYMRLLHRLSSVAFGTALGRLLVRFLILPYGLAFFVVITPGIAMEELEKLFQWVGLLEKPPAPTGHAAPHAFPMPNLWGVVGLGVFFLLLLHVGSFRSGLFYGLGKIGAGLQAVFIDVPRWLVNLPTLQAILHNRFWRLLRRFVIWPVLMAISGGLIAWWNGLETRGIAGAAAVSMALGIVLLNTRLGRDVEEVVTDWLLRFWVWFTIDLVPGLLRLIMDVSRLCLETVEQVLYTVNEWLRFRSGENQAVIVLKAILGLLWFCVTYVVRFAINLLIEPQVNPIKHFPVVTVSHKICLPMIPTLADLLRNTLDVRRPTTAATGIIFAIPGIFGFMVWELKENWRLYRANRAAKLKPVLIGSHGETMLRLLHPGFHSGTVPKLYQRLRRAERRGQQRTVRKIKSALHHVEESVAHFIERELVALLRRSKSWSGLTVDLGHIRLATNRILVELECRALGEKPLVFSFDHQDGWLLAGVLEPGWLVQLNPDQRQTLAAALAGVYKMAGVHLTREQIAAALPPTTFAYNLTADGLLVWTDANASHDVTYDLNAGPELSPKPLQGALPAEMPTPDVTRLLLSNVSLTWEHWVRICDGEHAEVASGLALLPVTKTP